jgi:hypothetical protein
MRLPKTVTRCPRRDQIVSHVISSLYHVGPGRQIAFDAGTIMIHEKLERKLAACKHRPSRDLILHNLASPTLLAMLANAVTSRLINVLGPWLHLRPSVRTAQFCLVPRNWVAKAVAELPPQRVRHRPPPFAVPQRPQRPSCGSELPRPIISPQKSYRFVNRHHT